MEQKIINANGDYCVLDEWLQKNKSIMLVCGKSIEKQKINEYFNAVSAQFGLKIIRFSGFTPNPTYESVIEGIAIAMSEATRPPMHHHWGSSVKAHILIICMRIRWMTEAQFGTRWITITAKVGSPQSIPFFGEALNTYMVMYMSMATPISVRGRIREVRSSELFIKEKSTISWEMSQRTLKMLS